MSTTIALLPVETVARIIIGMAMQEIPELCADCKTHIVVDPSSDSSSSTLTIAQECMRVYNGIYGRVSKVTDARDHTCLGSTGPVASAFYMSRFFPDESSLFARMQPRRPILSEAISALA